MGSARKDEGEAMDEELVEPEVPTVGERLRAARDEKGLTLEDIAAQTRIPQRHLESIETSDWARLPAPTYTIGFARNYATAVGLDPTEIADQLRGELGGARPATTTEVFEPADPRRTMPKSLVFGAIAAVIVIVILMSWLNRRALEQPDETANNVEAAATAPAPAPPSQATPAAGQQVTLTATNAVWIQVSEKGGPTIYTRTLQPGQTYVVPATATAPMLKTGMPEALRVTVGTTVAPPLGPPATTVNVSLLPDDLLKTGQSAAAAPPPPAPPPTAPAPKPRRPRATARAPAPTTPPAPPPPPPTTVTTTNTGE